MTIGDLLQLEEGTDEESRKHVLGYTQSSDPPGSRAEIAKLYATVGTANILAQAGGEEVIFTFMNAVSEPGDHVIVHCPSYQSLHEIATDIKPVVSSSQISCEQH